MPWSRRFLSFRARQQQRGNALRMSMDAARRARVADPVRHSVPLLETRRYPAIRAAGWIWGFIYRAPWPA